MFIFSFSQHNDKYSTKCDYKWKKHRWCAWNMNPGPQHASHKQMHWAMVAPNNGLYKSQSHLQNGQKNRLRKLTLASFKHSFRLNLCLRKLLWIVFVFLVTNIIRFFSKRYKNAFSPFWLYLKVWTTFFKVFIQKQI